jgi:hypothetical protein
MGAGIWRIFAPGDTPIIFEPSPENSGPVNLSLKISGEETAGDDVISVIAGVRVVFFPKTPTNAELGLAPNLQPKRILTVNQRVPSFKLQRPAKQPRDAKTQSEKLLAIAEDLPSAVSLAKAEERTATGTIVVRFGGAVLSELAKLSHFFCGKITGDPSISDWAATFDGLNNNEERWSDLVALWLGGAPTSFNDEAPAQTSDSRGAANVWQQRSARHSSGWRARPLSRTPSATVTPGRSWRAVFSSSNWNARL